MGTILLEGIVWDFFVWNHEYSALSLRAAKLLDPYVRSHVCIRSGPGQRRTPRFLIDLLWKGSNDSRGSHERLPLRSGEIQRRWWMAHYGVVIMEISIVRFFPAHRIQRGMLKLEGRCFVIIEQVKERRKNRGRLYRLQVWSLLLISSVVD